MNSVSFYIPCYNAQKTISACLESVLGQSFPVKEILVVDDGSSDETIQAVGRYPVALICHGANRGLAAARNSALRQAKGDFVASIDADCVCDKDWLARLMDCFSSPDVVGAGGKLMETYQDRPADLWRAVHMKQHWGDAGTCPSFLFGSNAVFRADAVAKAGLYDETLKNNYEDVDLCARLKKTGCALVYEPKAIARHLRRDNTETVLNSYWRWYLAYYRREKFYDQPGKFRFKVKENLGTANRFFEEDLVAGNRSLIFLDFLFVFHHSLSDLKIFLDQRPEQIPLEASRLSLWLAFVDFVFFSHYDADAPRLRTFLKSGSAFEQNCFALILLLGRFIAEKFPSEDFRKSLFHQTLLTLFSIDDSVLADKIFEVLTARPDWSFLCDKNHPALDKAFLEEFFQTFVTYVERLIVCFPDMAALAETSARSTLETKEVS